MTKLLATRLDGRLNLEVVEENPFLAKFYQDHVLLEQTFVNAEKFEGTIEEYVQALAIKMGENISVRRIARVAVGG